MSEEIKNFQLVEEKTSHSQTFLEFEKEFLSLQDFAFDIIAFRFKNINNLKLKEKINQATNLISIIKEAYDYLSNKEADLLQGEKERAEGDLVSMYRLVKKFYNLCKMFVENVTQEEDKKELSNAIEELETELLYIQNTTNIRPL